MNAYCFKNGTLDFKHLPGNLSYGFDLLQEDKESQLMHVG